MIWCCLVAEWLHIIGSLQSMNTFVNKWKGKTTIIKTNAEKVSNEVCVDICRYLKNPDVWSSLI